MELNAFAKATAFKEGLEPTTLATSAPHSSQLSKKKTSKRSLEVELNAFAKATAFEGGVEPLIFLPHFVAGRSSELSKKKDSNEESFCGAKGSRTPDLLHAMQAL